MNRTASFLEITARPDDPVKLPEKGLCILVQVNTNIYPDIHFNRRSLGATNSEI